MLTPDCTQGVTTYAGLRRSGAKSGQWVVISGAGGGLVSILVPLMAPFVLFFRSRDMF